MGMSVMSDVTLVPQKSDIWWIFLLQGFAGIIIGLMLITEPGATMVALMTVLGFYWLITGVLALVQVFVDRATPWIWSLLAGLIGILAGLKPPTQDRRRLSRYMRRWLVERFFAWIQWQRRILVRWEYHAQNFLGFVQLACLVMLFRRF
jgi:hypothetical protein